MPAGNYLTSEEIKEKLALIDASMSSVDLELIEDFKESFISQWEISCGYRFEENETSKTYKLTRDNYLIIDPFISIDSITFGGSDYALDPNAYSNLALGLRPRQYLSFERLRNFGHLVLISNPLTTTLKINVNGTFGYCSGDGLVTGVPNAVNTLMYQTIHEGIKSLIFQASYGTGAPITQVRESDRELRQGEGSIVKQTGHNPLLHNFNRMVKDYKMEPLFKRIRQGYGRV